MEVKRLRGLVEKGWGSELIFASNDLYCGKLLNFKEGARFSMHFHAVKDETWHFLSGKFNVTRINTETAEQSETVWTAGQTLRILPLVPHRIHCIEAGTIIEVSTPDSIADNYRVLPGDSQLR